MVAQCYGSSTKISQSCCIAIIRDEFWGCVSSPGVTREWPVTAGCTRPRASTHPRRSPPPASAATRYTATPRTPPATTMRSRGACPNLRGFGSWTSLASSPAAGDRGREHADRQTARGHSWQLTTDNSARVPGPGTRAPGAWQRVPGIGFRVSTRLQVPDSRHPCFPRLPIPDPRSPRPHNPKSPLPTLKTGFAG